MLVLGTLFIKIDNYFKTFQKPAQCVKNRKQKSQNTNAISFHMLF